MQKEDKHQAPPRNPKVILFDLDGTLIDTMQLFADIAAEVLSRYAGLAIEDARSRYLATSGIPFLYQLEEIVPGHKHTRKMSADFERRKAPVMSTAQMDRPTVSSLLDLQSKGILFGISSNNHQRAVSLFADSSPVQFKFALGYSSGLRKGEPHIKEVERICDCNREQILFVGDSLKDAEIAAECGISFIAVTSTHSSSKFIGARGNTVCITTVSQLPSYLDLK